MKAVVRFGGVGHAASERRWASSLKVSKSSLRARTVCLPSVFGSETGVGECEGRRQTQRAPTLAGSFPNGNDAQILFGALEGVPVDPGTGGFTLNVSPGSEACIRWLDLGVSSPGQGFGKRSQRLDIAPFGPAGSRVNWTYEETAACPAYPSAVPITLPYRSGTAAGRTKSIDSPPPRSPASTSTASCPECSPASTDLNRLSALRCPLAAHRTSASLGGLTLDGARTPNTSGYASIV